MNRIITILCFIALIGSCKKAEPEAITFTTITVLDGGKWPYKYNFDQGEVYTEVSFNLNQQYVNPFTYRDSVIFY